MMTLNRKVRWLTLIALGVAMLGAPVVAEAGPVMIGSLSSYEDSGAAVFTIFNITDDARVTGTLRFDGGGFPVVPVDIAPFDMVDIQIFPWLQMTRAYFEGTLVLSGPTFHLVGAGGPPGIGYVPVPGALAFGELPNVGQPLVPGITEITLDVTEVQEQVIPEPASVALFGTGLVLAARARKRGRRS